MLGENKLPGSPSSKRNPVSGSAKLSCIKHMPLSIGDKIGHYTVLSLLGKGGMGEVNKARGAEIAAHTCGTELLCGLAAARRTGLALGGVAGNLLPRGWRKISTQ